MVIITPAWTQEGKEYTIPVTVAVAILTAVAIIITIIIIIITPAFPLRGKPPIL